MIVRDFFYAYHGAMDTLEEQTTGQEDILEEEIEREKKEGGKETVDTFADNVVHRVQERVQKDTHSMQRDFGERMKGVGGDPLTEARTWAQSKKALLDPNHKIDDTASDGAAATFHRGTRETTYDDSAMDEKVDKGYWSRVKEHEGKHADEVQLNSGSLEFKGQTHKTNPRLSEGRATQHQPDSDLTGDYVSHKRFYHELGAYIEDNGELEKVMTRTGDVKGLQKKIDDKEEEKSGDKRDVRRN
jgi:hypothetical protein